jgi:hypothetical protein
MAIESEVEHIQLHDRKTIFYLVVVDEDGSAVDISEATVLDVFFKRPISKETFERTGVLHNGPTGIYKYALIIGDANEPGLFEIQGSIMTPTWEGSTEKGTFFVEDNLINKYWGSIPCFIEGV